MKGIELKRWHRGALVALSVVLFSLGWLRTSGLFLFAAFVPLLIISDSYGRTRKEWWRMAGWVALAMGLWTVATCWWIYYAAAVGIVAATIVQIVLFGGIFMAYHYASKRTTKPLAYTILIAGWLWAEHFYLNAEISFPWLLLGNGFANDVWAVQWYEYTGVLGGSLWVLLVNVLLFEWLRCRRSKVLGAGCVAALLLPMVLSIIVGKSFSVQGDMPSAKVTVVQPNFEPYTEKYTIPTDQQVAIMTSLMAEAPTDVDYIVLPETVIGDAGDSIWEHNIFGSYSVGVFERFRAEHYPSAQLITGAMTYRRYGANETPSATARRSGTLVYDRYNTALALDADSTLKVSHKSRLVVGVEKMPYMNLLKPLEQFIIDLGGTTGQLGVDKYRRTFLLRNSRHPYGLHAAAPICYESVYGEHFAGFAADGAQVMMVITNDGWWHDTEGYRQHFSFSRLRAIESRRWVCRAANTGISGFISPTGEVFETLGWDKRGTITMSVEPNTQRTYYATYGDYLGRLSGYLLLLSVLYSISIHFKRKDHLR